MDLDGRIEAHEIFHSFHSVEIGWESPKSYGMHRPVEKCLRPGLLFHGEFRMNNRVCSGLNQLLYAPYPPADLGVGREFTKFTT